MGLSIGLMLAGSYGSNEPSHMPNIARAFEPEYESRPRGYKTFLMLNSTEHEISTTHKI